MSEGVSMNQNKVDLKELEFCVFDLETTGGNHTKDGIIEIGLVVIKNKEIILEKNYLINPEQKIPEFIQKLTTITDNQVKDSPVIKDVIEEILEIMSDKILVAHNTSFDVPFFNSVLVRLGKPELKNRSICTNLMTKFLIPNLLSTNLTYMANIFNIDHGKAHRALDDARASAQLLLRYLEIFEQKDIDKINHLYYPRNKYELDRKHIKSTNFNLESLKVTLSKIKTPFLCTIKGPKGSLEYIIPLEPKSEHIKFIIEKINSMNDSWETTSFQIFGSYFETYLNFLKYASKLKHQHQDLIKEDLMNLFALNSNEIEYMEKKLRNNPDETIKNELGSFIVLGHLVEKQYLIISTQNLGQKNSLIFKYPAHQKKLQQFINSRLNKKINIKSFHLSFVSTLILITKNLDEQILATKSSIKKKQIPEIINDIERQLSKYDYPHNYPQCYI